MMTDIDPTRAGGPRSAARLADRLVAALVVLGALVAGAVPATVAADADGRADWRMPRTATGSGAGVRVDGAMMPADEPADAAAGKVADNAAPAAARGNAPPVLGGIASQTLRVGRPWRLHVRPRDPDGELPTLLARDLPEAARLADEGRGWYRLEWTPPAGAAGEVDLTLVAVDARDPRLRSERVLRLRVVSDDARPVLDAGAPAGASPGSIDLADRSSPVDPGSGDTADDIVATKGAAANERRGAIANEDAVTNDEVATNEDTALNEDVAATDDMTAEENVIAGEGASPSPAPPSPLSAPRLAPLASQIVSAGRTVSFRVAATLDDAADRLALLQIDRLPRHASFDENPDGSRSFYWPTGDRDQGEHRFRITALHPDDAALASRVDLLVIVGDPSRAVTVPLGERIVGGPVLPALDVDPPAASSADDEPFLPQAGVDGSDDVVMGPGGADDPGDAYEATDLPEPDDADFESFEESYLDDDDGMPLGPDGQPLEP